MKSRHIADMYQVLAALPPFTRYRLPPNAEIDFKITRSKMQMGAYDTDPHTIYISTNCCKTYQSAFETLAHEMVHLALERKGSPDHSNHDSAFNSLAAEVCTIWGWNFKEF